MGSVGTIKIDGKKLVSFLNNNSAPVDEPNKAVKDVLSGEKSADKQNEIKVKETRKDEKDTSLADKKMTPTKEVSALKDLSLTSSAKKSENQNDKNDKPIETIKTGGKEEISVLNKDHAPVNEGSKAVNDLSSGEKSADKQNEVKVK